MEGRKKRDEDLTIQACDESETTRQKKEEVLNVTSCDLDNSEAEESLVKHDDLVLVTAVIHDVAQC